MREPNKTELQSIRVVILNKEELELMYKHHMKVSDVAEKQIRMIKDRYMDKIKTDRYYAKMDYHTRMYNESMQSLRMIEEIMTVTEE